MTRQRYQHLYSRYAGVSDEVKDKLMDRGFVEELVSLVARYQGKSGVGREKWFRNHWTVPKGIMEALREGLDLDTEVFASPLNVDPGTQAYCSAFDRDRLFGSLGSAWDYQWTRSGGISLEFNPEYEAEDLRKALKWALASAESTEEPFLALGVYPVWGKSPYAKVYQQDNPYIHELIRVPQTYFDFQTPDFWKGGDSSYAHSHATWDVRFFVIMNKAGAEKTFHGKEDWVYDTLKAGFSKLTCANSGGERFLRISPDEKSDGLRGSAVLDTRPYDNWQLHWDKVKHPKRDDLADDYVFNTIIDGTEGIVGTEIDPRKGFRDQDWDERAPTRNTRKFPLLAFPELEDYPRGFWTGSETLEEASSFRFGNRVVFAEEQDYKIKKMLACCPPPRARPHLYGRFWHGYGN